MNYIYKNYLYIYNIKLIEENTLLIKKSFKQVFCFTCSKKLFDVKTWFFLFKKKQKLFSKIQFSNLIFFKHQQQSNMLINVDTSILIFSSKSSTYLCWVRE